MVIYLNKESVASYKICWCIMSDFRVSSLHEELSPEDRDRTIVEFNMSEFRVCLSMYACIYVCMNE